MGLDTLESLQLGLKKETSRGTAESAPDIFRSILADSVLDYSIALLPDEAKRAIAAKFPARAGTKTGVGTLKMPIRASEVVEFFQMLLGDPSSVLDSTALAFKHTMNGPGAGLTPPSFTAFLDRGASIGIKGYNLLQVAALTLSGDQEGLALLEGDMRFKTEAAGAIGSPSFTGELPQFTSYEANIKIDDVLADQVKTYNFKIANTVVAQRTLNQSQDIKDLLSVGPLMPTGTLEVYLSSETERAKFLAATQSKIELLLEGALIEDTSKETVQIIIPKAKYTAAPIGDLDGLFGIAFEFEGEFSIADSRIVQVNVINKTASYP